MRELQTSRFPSSLQSFSTARNVGGASGTLGDLRQPHSIPSDLLRTDRSGLLGAVAPPSLLDRFSSSRGAFTLSDSSIDRKKHNSGGNISATTDFSADDLGLDLSPRMLMRLQGKSKSALQLNQDQDNLPLNQLPEAALIEMIQSYQLGDR